MSKDFIRKFVVTIAAIAAMGIGSPADGILAGCIVLTVWH